MGLVALAILLQSVWAGMFIRPGRANDLFWVTVHARGGEVAIACAVVAAAVAFRRLRSRRDLVVGSAVLVVLLLLEAFIGGEVFAHQALTAVHLPLALTLMSLAAWLFVRARR